MRKLTALILMLMSILSVYADDITVDGTKRNYLVYVPRNLGEKRPLLISCHGMNQDAAYQKGMLQIESVADTAKFVTVFPNGIDRSWDLSGNRDLHFMEALIDKMVERYDIDRNRVYLSGFSMGGMFTYFAINRMADVFAAFAPISGYPLWGANFTSSRPVPIIHTHGTSDDVVNFSGVSSVLAGWVKRNGCPSQAKVEKPYRASHITRHTWGPGENGVEVVLMEMANKGHWISNDNGVKTGEEIWRFCKRFSLKVTEPTVRLLSPKSNLSFVSFGGECVVPDILLEAEASDPDGYVEKVAFYVDDQLLAELKEPPYTYVLQGMAKGNHTVSAVAYDDEGRMAKSSVDISVTERLSTATFVITNFDVEGSVPDGWETYDGSENRVGFSDGFSQGSRVFHFTGAEHDFDWGLYTRNTTGGARAGYAKYATEKTSVSLMLYPGNYQLYMKVANWNQPSFSPVTVAVETLEGEQVFAETFTPTANVGNAASNSFSGTSINNYLFDINEANRYIVAFYTADASWADLVLGRATLRRKGDSGVSTVSARRPVRTLYYNLAGQRISAPAGGLYVEKTMMDDGSARSRVVSR